MDIMSLIKRTASVLRHAFSSVKAPRVASAVKKHRAVIAAVSAVTAAVMLMSVVLIKRNEVTVFIDGEEYTSFTTLKNDSAAWLELAGIALYDGDEMTLDGTDVYITRAFFVNISADGMQTALKTSPATVREVLKSAEIEVSDGDIVNPTLDTVLLGDSQIEINRVSTATVTETQTVEFSIERVNTDELYVGQTKVKTKGENGKKEYAYSITYVDGKETERTLVSEKTVKEPVDKVILVGTKKKPVVSTASTPTEYKAVYTMKATAYTYGEDGGNRTATGIRPYRGVVAVDPSVIPLGSKLYIETSDGSFVYGNAVAADTGGAIKGNRVDIFFESNGECISFGRRTVNVYIIG